MSRSCQHGSEGKLNIYIVIVPTWKHLFSRVWLLNDWACDVIHSANGSTSLLVLLVAPVGSTLTG